MVAAECRKFGGKAIGLKLDVTNEAERVTVIEQVVQEFGRLTILITMRRRRAETIRYADGRFRSGISIKRAFSLPPEPAAHPHMKVAGGGAILNISSMAGENKNRRMCSYGASKAAVNHLTRNMALDLGPDNIRVNAIAPGAIRTASLDKVLTPDIEKTMLKHTPLGRLGEGTDIAAAALVSGSPGLGLGQRAGAYRKRRRRPGT